MIKQSYIEISRGSLHHQYLLIINHNFIPSAILDATLAVSSNPDSKEIKLESSQLRDEVACLVSALLPVTFNSLNAVLSWSNFSLLPKTLERCGELWARELSWDIARLLSSPEALSRLW